MPRRAPPRVVHTLPPEEQDIDAKLRSFGRKITSLRDAESPKKPRRSFNLRHRKAMAEDYRQAVRTQSQLRISTSVQMGTLFLLGTFVLFQPSGGELLALCAFILGDAAGLAGSFVAVQRWDMLTLCLSVLYLFSSIGAAIACLIIAFTSPSLHAFADIFLVLCAVVHGLGCALAAFTIAYPLMLYRYQSVASEDDSLGPDTPGIFRHAGPELPSVSLDAQRPRPTRCRAARPPPPPPPPLSLAALARSDVMPRALMPHRFAADPGEIFDDEASQFFDGIADEDDDEATTTPAAAAQGQGAPPPTPLVFLPVKPLARKPPPQRKKAKPPVAGQPTATSDGDAVALPPESSSSAPAAAAPPPSAASAVPLLRPPPSGNTDAAAEPPAALRVEAPAAAAASETLASVDESNDPDMFLVPRRRGSEDLETKRNASAAPGGCATMTAPERGAEAPIESGAPADGEAIDGGWKGSGGAAPASEDGSTGAMLGSCRGPQRSEGDGDSTGRRATGGARDDGADEQKSEGEGEGVVGGAEEAEGEGKGEEDEDDEGEDEDESEDEGESEQEEESEEEESEEDDEEGEDVGEAEPSAGAPGTGSLRARMLRGLKSAALDATKMVTDPAVKAAELRDRAKQLSREGKGKQAAVLFDASHALNPTVPSALLATQARIKLGQYAKAAAQYKKLLGGRAGVAALTPPERQLVKLRLAEANASIARCKIKASSSKADPPARPPA